VLALLTIFTALILAVTLYALTRDEDAELAPFALTCRGWRAYLMPFQLLPCWRCYRFHFRRQA
jgi:hypothetical protein